MKLHIDDDPEVDEEWLSLVFDDLWDMVKRVRRQRGKRQEQYTLTFPRSQVEITVRRIVP